MSRMTLRPRANSETYRGADAGDASTLLPARPGFGKLGQPIRLLANVFQARVNTNVAVVRYMVNIQGKPIERQNNRNSNFRRPPKDIVFSPAQCREILFRMLELRPTCLAPAFNPDTMVYDGGYAIWATRKVFKETEVKLVATRDELQLTRTNQTCSITIFVRLMEEAKRLDWSSVNERDVFKRDTSSLQCIDVALKERWSHPSAFDTYHPEGPRKFFRIPQQGEQLQRICNGMLEIWNGHSGQFVVIGDSPKNAAVHLQLDAISQAFFTNMPALEFLVKVLQPRDGRAVLNRRLRPDELESLAKAFKGMSVRATRAGAERTYRVVGLTPEHAKDATFPLFDEQRRRQIGKRKVADYFRAEYDYTLQNGLLPCFVCNNIQDGAKIPIEVCDIARFQALRGFRDKQQQSEFMKATARSAPERLEAIEQVFHNEDLGSSSYLAEFGVSVSDRPSKVHGRVLPSPVVQFYKIKQEVKKASYFIPMNDRRKNDDNNFFYLTPNKTIKWSVMILVDFDALEEHKIEVFFKKLIMYLQFRGLAIEDGCRGWHTPPILQAFDAVAKTGSDLVFFVLPDRDFGGDEYEHAKFQADTQYGIASQGVRMDRIKNVNQSIISNLAMQINTKLLGCAAKLDFEKQPMLEDFLREKATLVIGLDVIHPDAGDSSMPSVAAMVSSTNNETWTFYTTTEVQNGREEIVRLKDMLVEHLDHFRANNGTWETENILLLRDGVDDGKFQKVLTCEMEQIRLACVEAALATMPKITFVIVKKRTNMLLFCADRRDEFGRGRNCPPGTVVDRDIVNPNGFDFWLMPHAGILGTSHPIHCHVVRNDANLCADDLQYLLFALCHIDGRGTRATSIPIPIHYADLVCTRFQAYLKVNGQIERFGAEVEKVRGNAKYSETQLRELTDSGRVRPELNGRNYFL